MGEFSIKVNNTEKVINVKVTGYFSSEDGRASIEAYHAYTEGVYIPDFMLDIDCTDLEVSAPETLPHLAHCFELYKRDGFKKVIFRIHEDPVVKMQLTGLAKVTQLAGCEFIEVASN